MAVRINQRNLRGRRVIDGNRQQQTDRKPGSLGPRGEHILKTFAGSYYFAGIGQAIEGGLWWAAND